MGRRFTVGRGIVPYNLYFFRGPNGHHRSGVLTGDVSRGDGDRGSGWGSDAHWVVDPQLVGSP